jgi:molybdopterin molybdotransferase
MADCCSAPGLMPFDEALSNLLNTVSEVTEVERVAITDADQRVLAQDIVSPLNVPAHNNSAMDGYALSDAHSTQYTLVGTALAGDPFAGQLNTGECIRIMTGAVVPETATTVVMQENVDAIHTNIGNVITLSQPAKANSNIRLAGEDIKTGQTVFSAGHQLNAVDIGLLSSLGLESVEVLRKLKVAIFATGDELKSPGQALSTGDIYESNSTVVIGMLDRLGFDVLNLGIIPDKYELIKQAFLTADEQADAVISSGGVSVGDADYTKDCLDELGDIGFWKVAMKPGKPFAFGQLPNSVFFGLPGNPVSATVTFHKLAMPALQKMAGAPLVMPMLLKAGVTHKLKKRPGRMDFQRGIARNDNQGNLVVTPASSQGSGILSSLSNANCYIVLSQDSSDVEQNDLVDIEMFDTVLGR